MGKNLERNKMSNVKGNSDGGSYVPYELKKRANIAENNKRLAELNLVAIASIRESRPNKILKTKHKPSITRTEPPSLRPRPQRSKADLEEAPILADFQADGDFLTNNEDPHDVNLSNVKKHKKAGRGVTKKEDIFSRKTDMPKIPIILNEHGQPVGENARKLSSVIGCLVRKTLSLACSDWRLVGDEKKYKLWEEIKKIYDIDDEAYNWFMRTCGRKWKEFKATIKELYFKPEMTIEEVGESLDKRIPDPDWKWLFNYWMSPEFERRSRVAKDNRSKLGLHHTSGSVSYACSEYNLALELGRPPRRDETFVKTHTRKNGVPSSEAEPIITKLKDILELYPELKDRTIQEGDAFAVVCGPKEPRGYVRGIGLGPTPQDIGTPGLKCYKPTRLQMEILARKKVENEKAALLEHVHQLQSQIDAIQQKEEQDRASTELMSQHGSTSRHQDLSKYKTDGAKLDQDEDDYASSDGDDGCSDEDIPIHGAAQSGPEKVKTTPRSNDAPCLEHDALVGKHVILYALLRSDQPVAKGVITSTKPSTKIGGQTIGREFCEVVVTCVLKRDALLARTYDNMETMGDAHEMPIAWPYKKLKIMAKSSAPLGSGSKAG